MQFMVSSRERNRIQQALDSWSNGAVLKNGQRALGRGTVEDFSIYTWDGYQQWLNGVRANKEHKEGRVYRPDEE